MQTRVTAGDVIEGTTYRVVEAVGLPGNLGGVFLLLVLAWFLLVVLMAVIGGPVACCRRR